MRIFAGWQLVDQQRVQFPLQRFQPDLGRHDQTLAAGALGDGEGHVVHQDVLRAVHGKVTQRPQLQLQCSCDVLLGVPHRQSIALELLVVGGEVAHIAVAGAQGCREQAARFVLGERSLRGPARSDGMLP